MSPVNIISQIKNFFYNTYSVPLKQFSDNNIQEIFRENYNGLLYYNFDSNTWNRNNYLGYEINNQILDTEYAIDAANAWKFYSHNSRLRPVAMAFMAVNLAKYRGDMRLHILPRFEPTGTAIVAAFLTRDAKSGRITPFDGFWVGVGSFDRQDVAACVAPIVFADRFARNAQWRNTIFDMFLTHGK